MKWFIAMMAVTICSLLVLEASACDPYNSFGNFSASKGKNNFNSFGNVGMQSGVNYQYAAARAKARSARLKPLRIANAKRKREKDLIAYQQRRDERIANRELRQREAAAQQQLLADSRDWSDITGKYTIRAKLISADGQTVQLKKIDGTQIEVAISRLSSADQVWLTAKRIELQNETLLVTR